MSIFRKKDVGLAQTEMKRHLTLRDVVLLGIGAMVGTGIFTITGTAASTLAGPALIISVLISAVCVGMSAIFFAEFASRYPSAGGVYGYLDGWLVDHDCLYECRIQCCLWLGCLPQGSTG